jgi:PEP-CTERM motif
MFVTGLRPGQPRERVGQQCPIPSPSKLFKWRVFPHPLSECRTDMGDVDALVPQKTIRCRFWRFNSFWSPDETPAVPEPETYAMLIAGLGVLGAVSRRRKSSAKRMAALA